MCLKFSLVLSRMIHLEVNNMSILEWRHLNPFLSPSAPSSRLHNEHHHHGPCDWRRGGVGAGVNVEPNLYSRATFPPDSSGVGVMEVSASPSKVTGHVGGTLLGESSSSKPCGSPRYHHQGAVEAPLASNPRLSFNPELVHVDRFLYKLTPVSS